jgi:two-component system, OmpR family, copper resistance phosphate regulon response regulator CusR
VATVVGTRPSGIGLQSSDRRRAAPLEPSTELARILVADDEPRISSFLERGLAASGFATAVADNGEAALALARSGRFDAIVIDASIASANGLDVVRELRAGDPTIPVLVLAKRELHRDEDTGLYEGADDYLMKPFAFGELLERLRWQLCLAAVA